MIFKLHKKHEKNLIKNMKKTLAFFGKVCYIPNVVNKTDGPLLHKQFPEKLGKMSRIVIPM